MYHILDGTIPNALCPYDTQIATVCGLLANVLLPFVLSYDYRIEALKKNFMGLVTMESDYNNNNQRDELIFTAVSHCLIFHIQRPF